MSHFLFDYYGPLSFHILTDIIQVCAVKEHTGELLPVVCLAL